MPPSPSRGARGRRPGHHAAHNVHQAGAAGAAGGNAPKGVQVLVRVRPMLPRELQHDNAVEVLSEQELVVFKPNAEFASAYDTVLGPHSTQHELYQLVQGSILSAIDGYNATVFAYGQTGTGKTFSMMGPPNTDLAAAANAARQGARLQQGSTQWESLGIIPRALSDLFEQLGLRTERDGIRISVAATYLEIYNDKLYDLLQPYKKGMGGRDPQDMQQFKALHEVREDKTGATSVPNALCVKVASLEAVLALLSKGAKHRAVRHTEMNMHSSRSHAILQLVVEQYPQGSGTGAQRGTVLRSKLNFVDLAGNERWNKEVDMGAERVGELTSINSSLSALATVVAALTEGANGRHVPYRDSKLTHLLQDSLGGNCQTSIVATVSPSVLAFDETVSTLKFADRASAIGNNPVVNTSRDLGSVLALKEREIARLRQLLAAYMEGHGGTSGGGMQQQGSGSGGGSTLAPPGPIAQAGAEAADSLDSAQQLLAELENTRRALEMERVLRAELEEQLKQAGPAVQAQQQQQAAQEPQQQSPATGGHGQPGQHTQAPSLRGAVDYLRVVTPADTSSDFSPSPTQNLATSAHLTSGMPASSNNPFKAVMSRRAELGLAPSLPGDQGSSTLSSPARFREPSPSRPIAMSAGGSGTTQRPMLPPGGGALRQSAGLHSAGTHRGGDHQSSLEATMRSIREQVMQLTLLEQENRQRMATMMTAGRAARASASPQRSRQRQLSGGPASVYGTGSPQRRSLAPAAGAAGPAGGILDNLALVRAAPPAAASAQLPHHDSFDQLVSAAHESVQQTQQAMMFTLPLGAPATAMSQATTPEANRSSYSSASQGWGRSAVTRAPGSTQASDLAAGAGFAEARQNTASSSLSAPVSSDAAPGLGAVGWGRSALLASSGAPLMPRQTPPLSAPPADSWGRSAIMQQHEAHHAGLSGSHTSAAHQHRYESVGASAKPTRNTSARSPGRLDKGSLIYILGSSASSIRAKAMASAIQGTAWG